MIGYIKINTYVEEEAVWLRKKEQKIVASVSVLDSVLFGHFYREKIDCY